ncbi:hypothetical protein BT69DRAFT_1327994 [Atractiella rhizophila]|nr:hypothetical protein BT69DRAFT_1327994 [Atractiella rhizophila]
MDSAEDALDWACDCGKYCGGEWRRVAKRTFDWHARYREADLGGIDGYEEEEEEEMARNSEGEEEQDSYARTFNRGTSAVHSTDASTTAPEGEQDPIEAILAEVEQVELRRLVRDGFARPTVGNEGEEEPKDDLSEKDSTDLEEEDSSDGEEGTGLAGVGEMDERGPIN